MKTNVNISSSDEERPVSPEKSGRQRKLDFVWMPTRLEHTPRGNSWIELNRNGRVKEISFSNCHNSQQMKELIRKNFDLLAQADFSRIRFYKSANRGNDLERFIEHRVPSGKELSKIYTASASKRVYFRFGKAADTDTSSSSAQQNNSATVTTVPSTVAASIASVSNNVVLPAMSNVTSSVSAHVVPSTLANVSTSVASSVPTTPYALATTAMVGNQVMTYQDWEKAGTIIDDLDPMGLLETNGNEDGNIKEDNRLTETLFCERILQKSQDDLPVFLNLNFEEICYQALQDRKVIVATVIVENDNNVGTLGRLLSGINNNEEVYFWIAKARSKSGNQVKSKFGRRGGSELFVLSPTLDVTNPVLVNRFSGDSLGEDPCHKSIQDAIERGKHALKPMLAEWEMLEEERSLKRKQDEEWQESYNEDRRKRVMTERKNRVADEPKDNYWVISVKLPDGPRMKRNFPKDGTYQQVYDWIGAVQPATEFTLHRVGDGFIREACQHDQKLTESEVLLLIIRSESEAEEMLQNEVSFIGNYRISKNQNILETTKDPVYLWSHK